MVLLFGFMGIATFALNMRRDGNDLAGYAFG